MQPLLMAQGEREIARKECILTSGIGTLVEYLSNHPKVDGLSPTPATGTRGVKNGKKSVT